MGDSFSTVGDSFSTLGDTLSTVEVVQYSGGNISTVGIASVLWSVFSTLGGYLQYMQGDSISTVWDNSSTVRGIQYSGGRFLISACLIHDARYFLVLRNEIFIGKFRKF